MSHSAESTHGTVAKLPFTPAEVESFQQADRQMAVYIVGLITSIFTMGLIGYTCVALWVKS